MKIGWYNREVVDWPKKGRRIKPQDLKILLLLNDVMWMHKDDIQRGAVLRRSVFLTSMKILEEKHLIRVARREVGPHRIKRMYAITPKGRKMAEEFINHLKSL